jgi:hypothetical protein
MRALARALDRCGHARSEFFWEFQARGWHRWSSRGRDGGTKVALRRFEIKKPAPMPASQRSPRRVPRGARLTVHELEQHYPPLRLCSSWIVTFLCPATPGSTPRCCNT